MLFSRKPATLPAAEEALPGRAERPFSLAERHLTLEAPLVTDDVPDGFEVAIFGLGCFWGAEEIFWQLPGVWSTSVGYAGGHTPHPSYEEVCSGRTGHTEAVRVVYDPAAVGYADLVKVFFEVHDPTQGMRQGNDVGTQYRSAIYWTTPDQEAIARKAIAAYQAVLTERGFGEITTEVAPFGAVDGGAAEAGVTAYYYAEDHHQQYLAKVPHGYRCHANTGVPFPD
ncbi:MAG: peptide-methionine (S)-S-oxide reductase MsrA [Nocardioides sp.]